MSMNGFTKKHVKGFSHVALVCSNLEKTIDFVSNKLGFPLIETVDVITDLNTINGKHIFFHVGGNNLLAYFWFPNAPASKPGISSANIPKNTKNPFNITSAHGSMNHIAFQLDSLESLKEYHQLLLKKDIKRMSKKLFYHNDDKDYLESVAKGKFNVANKYQQETASFVSFYVYGPDNEWFEFTYPQSWASEKNLSKL